MHDKIVLVGILLNGDVVRTHLSRAEISVKSRHQMRILYCISPILFHATTVYLVLTNNMFMTSRTGGINNWCNLCYKGLLEIAAFSDRLLIPLRTMLQNVINNAKSHSICFMLFRATFHYARMLTGTTSTGMLFYVTIIYWSTYSKRCRSFTFLHIMSHWNVWWSFICIHFLTCFGMKLY